MEKFVCPKCRKPLTQSGNSLLCAGGHCFDLAKEGYVNLLLPNMKNSKAPGDNAEMVRARFDFLKGDTYRPLAAALSAEVLKYAGETAIVLDAGCGSGYYSRVLKTQLPQAEVYGVDLAKEAVKLAAKHGKDMNYAVCGVYDLPFDDGVFDAVLCIFSPHAFTEYARVLRRGGVLLCIYPARLHLIELKQMMYGDAAYENEKTLSAEGFKLIGKQGVTFAETLQNVALSKLLMMTPYYYTTDKSALSRVQSAESLSVTFDFKIDTFIKE